MEEKIKDLKSKLKYLVKKGKDIATICKELNLNDYEVYGIVELMKQDGELLEIINGEIIKLKAPKKINDVYEIKHNLEILRLLLISDTHLCSKYDRLDILRYLYDKAEKLGIKHVLHSGDFTDGRSNRPEHIYELKETSYQGQVDYCIDKYPKFSGKTYVIQGNHDNWWYKSNGSEILKPISNARDDIVYLGADVADLKIGKLKVRLFHGQGGIAYAKSYKIQKYLDSISLNEKPDILQTGHIHQAFYYKHDQTHCFQTGCLENQTPYCRGMGFTNDKSCWWVDVYFDDKGNVYKIIPELEVFSEKVKRR